MADDQEFDTAWSVAQFAKLMDLDRRLLDLLVADTCIPLIHSGRSVRIPRSFTLTDQELIARGRAAYEESLEAAGAIVMKMQTILAKVGAEIQDSLKDGIHPVREPGTTLTSMDFSRREQRWPLDQLRSDLSWAQGRASAYQQALWQIDTRIRVINDNGQRSRKYL